jgi:hypothetical protein
LRLSRLVTLLIVPGGLAAQGREIEFHLGRAWAGGGAAAYELRMTHPLGGVFTHSVSMAAVVHDSLGRNRAFYGLGYELQALRRRGTLTAYPLAGVALGLSTDTTTQELGALWSVGAGVEWRPLRWLALGLEGRYRVEDRGPRGVWRLRSDARRGFSLAVGLGLSFGRREARGGSTSPASRLPPPEPPTTITGAAAHVVRTALDALGAPYRWGGTAENGFDCSGLIQYAYGHHGIPLPRMSRDQSRVGAEVPPSADALQAGDILLFAAQPGGGVTHVGMYVGEAKFIHSSDRGVRLSRLDPRDPEASWWLPRWVGARRIIQ